MDNSKREYWRNRNLINAKIKRENMRRLMVASLAFVVLFCGIGASFLIRRSKTMPDSAMVAVMISLVGIQAGFGGYAYYWMGLKAKPDSPVVFRSYWAVTGISFFLWALGAESRAEIMLYLGAMLLIFSLVPLLDAKEFLGAAGLELIFTIITAIRTQLDLEHVCYILIAGALGAVISRQSYKAFLRSVHDGCRLYDAKNQAETDPMTGLLNRRGLERRIGAIWPMCIRQRLSVAVIMMDIDNFKKYNDTFGHPMGDECIKAVAAKIKESVQRKTDYAARVGGEEFLVCLTGISHREALKWCKKCKDSIEELKIPQADDNFLPFVSISMGMECMWAENGKAFWTLRDEADRCLYQAKAGGKACIYTKGQTYSRTLSAINKKQYYLDMGFRTMG